MGSASVPSSTAQYQQVATGIWGSPQATKLALPILKPALGNIKEQQDMLLGVQHGDPEQMAAFFGLPKGASPEEAGAAAHRYMSGPKIEMPSPDAGQKPETPPTKLAARGGLMSLDGEDDRTFADGGSTAPKDISTAQASRLAALQRQLDANKKLSPADQKKYDSLTQQRQAFQQYTARQDAGKANLAAQGITPAAAYLGQAGYFGGAYDPTTNTFSVTNPYYNQATNVLQQMNKQPEQFGQATQAYNQAISGLGSLANYTPEQVQAAQAAAAQASRGDIRDIAAQQAQVERMQGGPNVKAVKSQAAQMTGPSSWTQEGTAAQYMSPYMQNVVDIQKREANRDFAKQMARLDAQAAGQGAFGGSRQALERSEARRAQAQRLGDIEAQGLQQAYGQGMQQFSTEQGQGLQAGQANLGASMQSILANQQAGMTAQQLNQLYGSGGFQAQAANQAAQNQAYNNYVAQLLAAQQANQGIDWNTVNLNTANQQQANLTNAQLAQQAALANQQAGLQANQQNIGAYGQMLGAAGGLGSLGTAVGGYNTNLANMWGQAGSTLQGLGQNYFNQQQQNAANLYGGPTTLGNQGMNLLGGMGGGQSGLTNQIQKIQ